MGLDPYPTDEELAQVAGLANAGMDKIDELLDLVKSLWWPDGDYGFSIEVADDEKVLCLDTWGWSGNEAIIGALEGEGIPTMFWLLTWAEIRRGGHYKFELPVRSE